MAEIAGATVITSEEVYKVKTELRSRTPVPDPVDYVINNEDVQLEIKAQAGIPEDAVFVAAVLLNEGYLSANYIYEILLTLDPIGTTQSPAGAHEHDSETIFHPLREAYRDGPYIDLDTDLGPVRIYADAADTVDYFQVSQDSHNIFLIRKDGTLTVGGHMLFVNDTIYDIGSADDGTTLYRPRDVYVGRDLWVAREAWVSQSITATSHNYFEQATTPDTDPLKRYTYWNSIDNQVHVWDGTTDYALGGGTGVDHDGIIFIDDLTPNVGNIDVTYTENGTRVTQGAATPDVTTITVHVFAYSGHERVRPSVLVNGLPVSWTTPQQKEPKAYHGTVDITGFTLPFTITAVHQDGNSYAVDVVSDAKPTITTLEFTGGYPGSQTELKLNDNFDINVQTDLPFVAVEVENSGACQAQSFAVGSTTNHTFTSNIADRGTTTQALPARVRVQKATGAWSDWAYTNDGGGTVDGVNLVNLNNTYPFVEPITQVDITYPPTQEAIKDSEAVTVHSTCTDFDTITYSAPGAQLSIPSPTTYAENKSGVARIAGGYNVTITNYRITANRAANDATTVEDGIVYIAHDSVQIVMTEPTSRLRTGGNDGTSAQDHTITMTADQRLIETPTIADPPIGGGTWQGAGWAGGPEVWTRDLQCHDNDTVGTYVYGSLVATNLARRVTTSYTGDSNYTIGGFVSRTVQLAAFANETAFNAAVADYTKCTLVWEVKSLPNRRAFNTTATPDPNSWCFAGTLGASPTTARILDTAATGSSSGVTNVTVEETV